jgi:ABC-type nitrate/sulfonate/bicarbonate transport system ATPase subunit
MFQESRLLPWLRVERNISFAISSDIPRVKKAKIVDAALRLVGLTEYGRAWPSQLSGGMAKRVALARAIVNLPYLLLLDEPLTALDSPTKYGLQDEIARIHVAEKEMTTILVTHDVDEAVYLSDRILVLSPMGSKVLVEIPVPLTRPRDRTSGEYRVICSAVTNDIFEQWWKASAQVS